MTSPSTSPAAAPAASPVAAVLPASVGFAEAYERNLVGPLFRPWAGVLLDRTPLGADARVLDVACGTGIVARLAHERLGGRGRIVGVDRNPGMLAVARATEPGIDWREGDAAELPLQDGERFDAVFCHQGMQFFPDRVAAARAMHRALAPGGRVVIGVWRSVEENGLFHDLDRAAEEFLGPVHDIRHGLPDPDALARLLTEAGFADVRVESLSRETRFEDAEPLVRMNAMALVGMSDKGKSSSEQERSALASTIAAASMPALSRYRTDGAIVFRTSANVATARA